MVVLIRIFTWETHVLIYQSVQMGTIEKVSMEENHGGQKMKLGNKNKWQVCFDNAVLYFRMD